MERGRRRAVAAVASLAMAAVGAVLVTRARSQPVSPVLDGARYSAWVPPGEYTAFIICSSGDERRWAVTLATRSGSVPIVVGPGANTVVPFERGWTVRASEEVRLVSHLVPFDDAAIYNKVGEEPLFVLSAWGITPTGPVPFVYRAGD